jgi:DNA processing protein
LSLVSGVGPRILTQLLDHFGSPENVLSAAPSELREIPGVGPKLARAISAATSEIDVAAELATCRDHGIQILTAEDEKYPRMLAQIIDPPGVLFLQGEITAADSVAVAIVGSRHATRYGVAQAERLAGGLARTGITVVGGLARGIDAAAHRAALAAGGRTIAVLGGGLLKIYPPEHQELAQQISRQGGLVSEMPPNYVATRNSFPQRNRIISGLSLGTIVVEAAERSGALITARHSMEQNREVFAVPGPVDSRNSRGCHALLRDGAQLVEAVKDVVEQLGPLVDTSEHDDGRQIRHPAELQLNTAETAVLQAIDTEPTIVDQIIQKTGLPAHRVLSTISVLEVRQLIDRLPGGKVARR